jgi:hypothetical protein
MDEWQMITLTASSVRHGQGGSAIRRRKDGEALILNSFGRRPARNQVIIHYQQAGELRAPNVWFHPATKQRRKRAGPAGITD